MQPQKLNGNTVIASAPRKGSGEGTRVVMVLRPNDHFPYVVATWSESLGKEWCWGHYHTTFEDACADYFSMTDWKDGPKSFDVEGGNIKQINA